MRTTSFLFVAAALAASTMITLAQTSNNEEPVFLDGLIAIVGDDAITFLDVTAHTKFQDQFQHSLIMNSDVKDKDAALRDALTRNRSMARQRLVDEELIYEDFKAKGFKLPEEYIRREYDSRVAEQTNGDYNKFEQLLSQLGMTREEFTERLKRQVAVQIYVSQFISRRIIIRPTDVNAYYQSHQEEFRDPAEVRLQSIRLEPGKDTPEAFRKRVGLVVSALPGADDFVQLEKSRGAELGKLNSADLGWVKVASMDKALSDALGIVRAGRTVGPFAVGNNVVFYHVAEARGGQIESFDKVRESIYNGLFQKEKQRRYDDLLVELRKRYYVRMVD